MHKLTAWLVGFLAVMALIYYFFVVHRYMKEEPEAAAAQKGPHGTEDGGQPPA